MVLGPWADMLQPRVISSSPALPDLVCLSHLRWNFVFQRPQHLMTRCARERRVYFVEEPIFEAGATPHLRIERSEGVSVVVPILADGLAPAACQSIQAMLIDELIRKERIAEYV